jgi:hypothetical protein
MTFFNPTAQSIPLRAISGFNRDDGNSSKRLTFIVPFHIKLEFFFEPRYLKPITKKIKMKKTILTIVFAITGIVAFAPEDAADSKDSPLFTRMPNYAIPACSHNYNQVDIPMSTSVTETRKVPSQLFHMISTTIMVGDLPFPDREELRKCCDQNGGKKAYSPWRNTLQPCLQSPRQRNLIVLR